MHLCTYSALRTPCCTLLCTCAPLLHPALRSAWCGRMHPWSACAFRCICPASSSALKVHTYFSQCCKYVCHRWGVFSWAVCCSFAPPPFSCKFYSGSCCWRPFGRATVGAKPRLSMGCNDMCQRLLREGGHLDVLEWAGGDCCVCHTQHTVRVRWYHQREGLCSSRTCQQSGLKSVMLIHRLHNKSRFYERVVVVDNHDDDGGWWAAEGHTALAMLFLSS